MPTQHQSTTVNPDRLRVSHPTMVESGRATARRHAAQQRPFDDAAAGLADALEHGWNRTAAFWLGYADELAGMSDRVFHEQAEVEG